MLIFVVHSPTQTNSLLSKSGTPKIAARSHFDSDVMIEMAKNCSDVLTRQPEIDLLEGISAHDLA